MSCNKGHSFNAEAITTFGCGPDTEWKWNGIVDINVPACSSTCDNDMNCTGVPTICVVYCPGGNFLFSDKMAVAGD